MPQLKRAHARRNLIKAKLKKAKVTAISLQEFQVFPKLPTELRDMIWKECIFPQVITIENDSQEYREPQYPGYQRLYKTVVKAKANFTTPAILHVCRESRDIGLKAYMLELQPQLGHHVYFNWERDTLFMENFDALLAFYGGPWANSPYFGNNMSNIERGLRHLVIGEEIPHSFVPTKVISRLYNLERLILPRPDGRGFAGEKAKKEMRELILGWMKEKQDLYSEQEKVYKEWALPEIEFLNKKQLADFEKEHGAEEFTVTGHGDQDDEDQEVGASSHAATLKAFTAQRTPSPSLPFSRVRVKRR